MARLMTAASASAAVEAIENVATRDSRPAVGYIVSSSLVGVAGAVVLLLVPAGAHHGLVQFLLLPVGLAALAFGLWAGLLALAVSGFAAIGYLAAIAVNPLSDPRLLAEHVLFAGVGLTVVILIGLLRPMLRHPAARSLPLHPPVVPKSVPDPLTPREIEVLRLTASGRRVSELATLLSVSPNTVKTHLAHAYDKLGARNRAQALAAGLRSGYLDEAAVAAASEIGSPSG
jgi:DNA-binding CsgD family transcriptional regulator